MYQSTSTKEVQHHHRVIVLWLQQAESVASALTEYDLHIANNREAASALLKQHTGSLLLTDDLDLCRLAAADAIPVLAVVESQKIEMALAAGAADYVQQPVTSSGLQHTTRLLLNHLHLQQREQFYESMLQSIGDAIMIVNEDGVCEDIINPLNPAFITPPDDLIGKSVDDFMPQQQADMIRSRIRNVLQTGETDMMRYMLHLLGDIVWYSASLSRLDDSRVMWVKRNTTEREETERALRESEQRYRHLFDAATDGILLIDIDTGNIRKANEQAAHMLQYSVDELEGTHISVIEVVPATNTTLQFSTQSGRDNFIMETQYLCKDNSILDVETSNSVILYENQSTILCFMRDISQRKQALRAEYEQRKLAEALRDAAAAFNNALELDDVLNTILANVERVISADAANIMLIGEDNIARIVRHRGYEKQGFTPQEIESLQLDVTQTQNLHAMCETLQSVIISDTRAEKFEWKMAKTTRWIRSYIGVPIVLRGGNPIGFINLDSDQPGFFTQHHAEQLEAFADQAAIAIQNARLFEQVQNHAQELEQRVQERTAEVVKANQALREQIQQRARIEDQLQEERTLLYTLIDNIPDAIYVKDTTGKILQANQAALEIARVSNFREAIGKTNHDLFQSDFARREHEHELEVIRSQQPQLNEELWYRDWDGNRHCTLASRIPLFDADDEIIGVIGILRDITELKEAEQQLQDERNMLRTLIDTIPDLIYIKDKDGKFLMANEATRRTAGVDVTQMPPGTGINKFDTYTQTDEYVLTTGDSLINYHGMLQTEDSEPRQYLVTKLPLRDDTDDIIGLIGIGRDITDLRRAEEQLEQVLTSARCLLWSAEVRVDETGAYVWEVTVANEAAAQTFLPIELNGRNYTDAWQDAIVKQDQERRRYVFKTHVEFNIYNYSQEFRCKLADGSIHWLVEDVQIKPINDKHWQMVGVCTDITTRKTAEQTLQQMNERLENRVQERTRELWQANVELKREVLERKRAEEAERRQRIIAEGLRDSVAMLNRHLERDAVLEYLLEAIVPVVPYDAASIMLLENDNQSAEVVRARGYASDITGLTLNPANHDDLQTILTNHEAVIISQVSNYEDWAGTEGDEWIQGHITVPITLEGEIIGFLNLDSAHEDSFTTHHAEWLKAFANQAGNTIRNARMVEEIRNYAFTLEQRVRERTAELESERAQLHAILDAMRDGVIFEDLNNQTQYINQALVDITGYDTEDWLNGIAQKKINTASEADLTQINRRVDSSLAQQGYWEGEMIFRHREGHTFDAGLVRTEVQNQLGERVGLVTVLRDISQEKQLAAQKARFIASASHELRTPIANMKTRLYLIQRRPDQLDDHITILKSVVNLMQNLVEDMFDISRFERGVINIVRQPTDLNSFVSEIVQYHQPEAERQDIHLSAALPPTSLHADIDPHRMTQVLSNIVSNALHYTPAGGSVEITLAQADDDHATITVADTGIGIEDDILPHLFQPFFRGDENDNRGAGLGLSIANEIIRLHNGRIDVSSTPGAGSQFTITIPQQHRQPTNPAADHV